MGYIFNSKEHGAFSPDGKVAMTDAEIEQHNNTLEAQELAAWAEKPEHFCAYVVGWELRTFTGQKLGRIISRSTHRNNLGANIEAISALGTNGETYYGRYGVDWSQLVRIRKSKKRVC